MNVKSVLFCRKSSNDEAKGLCADGIFNVLKIQSLPASATFSIIFFLNEFKESEEHAIRIEMISPDDSILGCVEGKVAYRYSERLEEEFQGMTIQTHWNSISIKTEGTYTVRFASDGKTLKEEQFCIMEEKEVASNGE